jgi:general secretion pathway protein G
MCTASPVGRRPTVRAIRIGKNFDSMAEWTDATMNMIPKKAPAPAGKDSASRGFTLLELMVVMTIIMILATIAAGRYENSAIRAKEAVLHTDLFTMRKAISDYTLDKEAGPQSLDDLVTAGYLREIPIDRMTGAKDWTTETDELMLSPEQTSSGVSDVHSASEKVSPFDGTAYSSW